MSTLYNKIHPSDEGKPQDVAVYLFDITIDEHRYCGDIPAKSWAHAEEMVSKFGGVIVGRSSLEIPEGRLCSVCSGDLKIDMEHPRPIDDDFPDEI